MNQETMKPKLAKKQNTCAGRLNTPQDDKTKECKSGTK